MTEEQIDQAEVEEAQEEVALEEDVTADEEVQDDVPAEEQKRVWPIVVTVIAVILALCIIVACISAAIAIWSGDGDEASVPTAAPLPTTEPSRTTSLPSRKRGGSAFPKASRFSSPSSRSSVTGKIHSKKPHSTGTERPTPRQ